eukprot:2603633-Rhodomonas_salina.5
MLATSMEPPAARPLSTWNFHSLHVTPHVRRGHVRRCTWEGRGGRRREKEVKRGQREEARKRGRGEGEERERGKRD